MRGATACRSSSSIWPSSSRVDASRRRARRRLWSPQPHLPPSRASVASRPRPLDPELLDVLTRPREACTAAAAAAREVVAAQLRALGYRVEVQPFRFDPSALRAFPLLGSGLAWLGPVLSLLLASPVVPGWTALGAWIAGAAALAVLVYRI